MQQKSDSLLHNVNKTENSDSSIQISEKTLDVQGRRSSIRDRLNNMADCDLAFLSKSESDSGGKRQISCISDDALQQTTDQEDVTDSENKPQCLQNLKKTSQQKCLTSIVDELQNGKGSDLTSQQDSDYQDHIDEKPFSEVSKWTFKDMNESDEVVFEADVFLSQALADSLYLFHYPTTNKCFATEEDVEYLSARIKPKQKKLEMEIGINTHSGSYDKSRGEQMAYNVDGQNLTGEPYFQSSRMDKYSLTGMKADKSNESYAVGFVRGGELHITPLHTVMELKPAFVHMDKMDSATKKAQNPEEEDTEEEAVAVTVRFEGPNAEKDRQQRQKSFQYVQQKNASEPWADINIHKLGKYKDIQNESTTPLDYVKELLPECYRMCGYSKDEIAQVQDPNQNLTLSDQIKQLLTNAHVLTMSMLMEKLPSSVSKSDVVQRIPQCAVLVQGCWAAKSELIYKEDSVSSHSGMSAKLLINARDYVLWLFTKSPYVTYREVLKVIYIPDADFQSMVSPMAIKANKRWRFKFSCDEEFLKSHPSVEKQQELKWEFRHKSLVNDLNMRDSEVESPKSSTTRPRQKRHSRSSISEGDESGTDTSAAKDAKSKRQQTAKKRLVLSPSKVPPKISASYQGYLECSPAVKLELGEFVGDALRSSFCMTFSELRALVLESHLGSLVGRGDFEKVLEEALAEYGAQKLKNKWPQNTVPESLYAFAKFGNKLDRYRVALLEMFSTTARARTNLFVKKVEDELREIISEGDCRQIFEEYCVYKSGFYYLKGTISPDNLL
ncbi:hypothetical protein JTE90_012116 [Oedothorax gibbosus]|uniref:DNA-directed RNA polymerase III subunit RPC5 C-terminal domain-containing protein n=1 Tax=Oedothorax gibbosus TaxID=931172 RepID=A0AAV6UWV3_9ARAC|nr:hypothetical protein JTE90_012116 [Oedothorax gibbosus]